MKEKLSPQLVHLIGWFGVLWGLLFLVVIGVSHYTIASNQTRFFGVPVLNVKEFSNIVLLGAPCLIALAVHGYLRKKTSD